MEFLQQEYFKHKIHEIFLPCCEYLEKKSEQSTFTAWSFANSLGAMSAFWADEYFLSDSIIKSKSIHPFFDLASLTKPLLVNLYLRIIWKNDFLNNIRAPLATFLLESNSLDKNDGLISYFKKNGNEKFTFDSFLSHFSGANSWFWMGLVNEIKQESKTEIIKKLNYKSLSSIVNSFGNTIYSDINYYLISRIIEGIESDNIDWNDRINILNNELNSCFFHASLNSSQSKNCIPYYPYYTVDLDKLRAENISDFGPCHDTNANIIASFGLNKNIVSGHAGLFGSVLDIVKAVRYFCASQDQFSYKLYSNNNFSNRFVTGFDTPSSPHSHAGVSNWDKNKNSVFGQLGFTGTSFWFLNDFNSVKPNDNDQFHVLLTNRTAFRNKNISEKCHRIFVYTDFVTNKESFYLKIGNEFSEISYDDLYILLKNINHNKVKIWDSSIIKTVENMLEIRNCIANNLWKI